MLLFHHLHAPLRRSSLSIFIGCVLVAWCAPVSANINWTLIGPDGGTVDKIIINPNNSNILFSLSYMGGVHRSTNAGASWIRITSNLPLTDGTDYCRFNDIAIDPITPSILYVATNNGLYRTSDAGATWDFPFPPSTDLVAVSPVTPDTIYCSHFDCLHKSVDGGDTWNIVYQATDHNDIEKISLDPNWPDVVYIHDTQSVLKSTDGGASWTSIFLTPDGMAPGIAIDPRDSSVVYLIYLAKFHASVDGGETWTQRATLYSAADAISLDPQNPDTIYVGYRNAPYLAVSVDAGFSWHNISIEGWEGNIHDVDVDPDDSQVVYLAGFSGVYKSPDGGASWQISNRGLNNLLAYDLVVNPKNPQNIFMLAEYNQLYRSLDSGATWDKVGTDSVFKYYWPICLEIDPVNPDVLYAGCVGGGLLSSADGGQNWTMLRSSAGSSDVLRICVHPKNTSIIVFSISPGSNFLRTTDGGAHWTSINNGELVNIHDVALDPDDPMTIYAAIATGLYKTTDGGGSWNKVLNTSSCYSVAVDPISPANVYVGSSGRLYLSGDKGTTWTSTTCPTPFVLVIDPSNPVRLHSIEQAPYLSNDCGQTWIKSDVGLPGKMAIRKLRLKPDEANTVYATLFGAGAARITYPPLIPTGERHALIDLYTATAGDDWVNNSGWRTPPLAADGFAESGTEHNWRGVTIANEHVTRIALGGGGLAGSIPPTINQLTRLTTLNLKSNLLQGQIPTTFKELESLTSLDIGYNALYSEDSGLTSFLNLKDPDWRSTQTVLPTNITALSSVIDTQLQIIWTPIHFSTTPGGYEVYLSRSVDGPFEYFGTTDTKRDTNMWITGLKPATEYFMTVRTVSEPHPNNPFVVTSGYSDPVAASTTCDPVVITSQPPYRTVVSAGNSTVLAVTVNGSSDFSYQWHEGPSPDTSRPIPGATRARYRTPSLNEDKQFWVRVTNPCGCSDSDTTTVVVVPQCQTSAAPVLSAPPVVPIDTEYVLSWHLSELADIFEVHEAADPSFQNPVLFIVDGSCCFLGLTSSQSGYQYYRVRSILGCDGAVHTSDWSNIGHTLIDTVEHDPADVDGNGVIDSSDVLLLAHFLTGNITNIQPNDLDGDHKFSATDLLFLKHFAVGDFR